jgi:uncharacterized protein YndB with AHSA1/START domain
MKSLTKVYKINASAQKVFEALTNPDLIEQWSGESAEMDIRPGGEFSLWNGDIHGKNHLVTPSQIVQEWKEAAWDHFSKVTFNISEKNGVTTLEMIHEAIPDRNFISINDGWDNEFLGPLKELLEEEIEEE